MALTDAFLATCRSAVSSLTELTTFRAALTNLGNGTRAERYAAWIAAFDGANSPALLLRQAIRGVVNAQADSSGALGVLDREQAYRTLEAEFVPQYDRPMTAAQESAALERLLVEDRVS